MPQESPSDTVAEQRHRLGAIGRLDTLEFLRDLGQGLIPSDLDPFFASSLVLPDERCLQPVRVEMRSHAPRATGAKPPPAQGIKRVALDLPESAVAHIGYCPAFPETDVAERGDFPDACVGRTGCRRCPAASRLEGGRTRSGSPDPGSRDFQEPPARNRMHYSNLHTAAWLEMVLYKFKAPVATG